jgi:hypothetical protein
MAAQAQRIAELEQQVSDLEARFAQLEHKAFLVKTLEEMWLERSGYAPPRGTRAGRARHLRAVGGGAS